MNTPTTLRLLRQIPRLNRLRSTPSFVRPLSSTSSRSFRVTPTQLEKDELDPYHKVSTDATGTSAGPHEGSAARTDRDIVVEYPPEEEFPPDRPLRGRGGIQYVRTLPTFSLEGRTAVVTGGARGLGLVMGQGLVQSGANLAIVDLNNDAEVLYEDEGEKQAAELMSMMSKENADSGSDDYIPKVTAHYADVSDPESVNACIAEIIKEHGKIDHLVTSAGFTENFSAETYPYERMKKLWGVNVDGTYLFSTAVGRHLMERNITHGSIVMIGSMSGSIVNVPQPQAPYNAAKAAVRHLAASLAVEWAHAHVRVNCISPGYMLTALTRKILDDNPELNKTWTSLIPVGKMGSPEDLQGAVVYLLSDASRYVTGADLRVDGGYTCT
ncbi:hypothetical protein AYO20_07354 [Fonsecaea nubica]|uniref:D-arabinitol 2-dehydrogenase [ribulose-forming] n=1 Tax=Fonsecaea nubica TaxID=856822 RepID=A0A178CW07_9EURO|nr:hypothetical protein AYO20_07354 [Fonsecaea nubica]OAL33343.1 hypothetical protein AYO20_07354 [Fonsecaea nubica]